MSDIIHVYTTYDAMEAELLKASLENEGIPCYLGGDGAGGVLPHLTAAQGIRVMIRKQDLEAVQRLLEGHE